MEERVGVRRLTGSLQVKRPIVVPRRREREPVSGFCRGVLASGPITALAAASPQRKVTIFLGGGAHIRPLWVRKDTGGP